MTKKEFNKLMEKLDAINENLSLYDASGPVDSLRREVAGLKKTLDGILDAIKKRGQ
jgi:hypothetical protein